MNHTGGRGCGLGAASPARERGIRGRHGTGREVRGKLCRGRALRRPRARPDLFIEIEDKASDPPVKRPAAAAQRKAHTVLVHREGGVDIEEELEGEEDEEESRGACAVGTSATRTSTCRLGAGNYQVLV